MEYTDGKEAQAEPKEIVLEKATAEALGRGLRQQIFTKERLSQIADNIDQLAEIAENAGIEKRWLSPMSEECNKIAGLLTNFEKAKEVKLMHTPDSQSGWDFSFSEEKQETENPQPGEIILDSALTAKLIGAISHNFNNSLSPIMGFSELIARKNQNASGQKRAAILNETSKSILTDLLKITAGEAECQLKLTTDIQGNTNISLISAVKARLPTLQT